VLLSLRSHKKHLVKDKKLSILYTLHDYINKMSIVIIHVELDKFL